MPDEGDDGDVDGGEVGVPDEGDDGDVDGGEVGVPDEVDEGGEDGADEGLATDSFSRRCDAASLRSAPLAAAVHRRTRCPR